MANGFRAPRIVGQGQIQRPTVLEETPMETLGNVAQGLVDEKKERDRYDTAQSQYEAKVEENKRRWEAERRESDRRYELDRSQRAQERNLSNKWRLQQHRNQAFKEWEASKVNQDFDEWYNEEYPDINSQLQQSQNTQDYRMWKSGYDSVHANPYVYNANIVNPYTGKISTYKSPEGFNSNVAENMHRMFASGNFQRGSYIPGNETGDTNPAMLEDGEYVLNRNAVDKLGKGFLDYINNEAYPRFQEGGFNQGVVGGVGQVTGPIVLEETPMEVLGDMAMQMVSMGTGAPTDALGGSAGMGQADLSSAVGTIEADPGAMEAAGSGFDPTMFMAQKGGYMEPKGYQEGGINKDYTYIDEETGERKNWWEEQLKEKRRLRYPRYEDELYKEELADFKGRRDESMQADEEYVYGKTHYDRDGNIVGTTPGLVDEIEDVRRQAKGHGSWANLGMLAAAPVLSAASGLSFVPQTAASLMSGAGGTIGLGAVSGAGLGFIDRVKNLANTGNLYGDEGFFTQKEIDAFNQYNPMYKPMEYLADRGMLEWAGVPAISKVTDNVLAHHKQYSPVDFPGYLHRSDQDKLEERYIYKKGMGTDSWGISQVSNDEMRDFLNQTK